MFILLGLFLIYTQSYTHFCSYQKTLCAISVILQKSHKSDIQQFDYLWLFVILRSREPAFPLSSLTSSYNKQHSALHPKCKAECFYIPQPKSITPNTCHHDATFNIRKDIGDDILKCQTALSSVGELTSTNIAKNLLGIVLT
jgi:hypothetical protein